MPLAGDQRRDEMRRVALAFGQNLHVVDFHEVFVDFRVAPREYVALAVVHVGFRDAREL